MYILVACTYLLLQWNNFKKLFLTLVHKVPEAPCIPHVLANAATLPKALSLYLPPIEVTDNLLLQQS